MMDVKPIILVVALISLLFVFGCTMPNFGKSENATPSGYQVSVNPRTIVPGGVSTIKFTIKNEFERAMKDVNIQVTNVPGDFSVNYNSNVGTIISGNSIPQVITISAPDSISIQEVITPKIRVCFDYTTDFYQDISFNPTTGISSNVTMNSGYTKGPVSVSVSTLELYPRSGSSGVTSIELQNNYIGKIEKINSITIKIHKADYMSGMDVNFYGCDATASTSDGDLIATITNCDKLTNPTVVGNGAQGIVKITFDNSVDSTDLQTLRGTINYTYCYNVDVGSITVKPVGTS